MEAFVAVGRNDLGLPPGPFVWDLSKKSSRGTRYFVAIIFIIPLALLEISHLRCLSLKEPL